MRPSRLISTVVSVAAISAAVAACSADSGDFSDNAEQLIDDDKDGDLAAALGVDFDGAECAEPANTDTGTSFECTATGDDGNTWLFTATITGDRDYLIDDAVILDGATAGPAGTSGTAGTTADTTADASASAGSASEASVASSSG
jgi:hypothetical protein